MLCTAPARSKPKPRADVAHSPVVGVEEPEEMHLQQAKWSASLGHPSDDPSKHVHARCWACEKVEVAIATPTTMAIRWPGRADLRK